MDWVVVVEYTKRIVVFLIGMLAICVLYLIGGEPEYYEYKEGQTVTDFNKQFAATTGDFEKYSGGMAKGWSKEKKEKYIMLSKKLESGETLTSEEFDWYMDLIASAKLEKTEKPKTQTLRPKGQKMIQIDKGVFEFEMK